MLVIHPPVIHTIDQAPFAILLHLAAAMVAVLIGGIVLFHRKGTHTHRMLGKLVFG